MVERSLQAAAGSGVGKRSPYVLQPAHPMAAEAPGGSFLALLPWAEGWRP